MPDFFTSTMQTGGNASTDMMMQGPRAPFTDPMGYFNTNKGNIDDVSKAAKMAADLAKQGKGLRFGARVRLSASQLNGFALTLEVQCAF